ncbi:MAG: homoserine O-acetyltransferase [Halieaceae bacterium]|jgi:homoserine O-acetyltransferase|nr:homoserine O-acetyltransferase [Halieaceae bacterium]MBT5209268.1 homoserine O-acetyltransferase [Halieaceae bacterium]MDG1493571.1 homoserine O-acetyltransferase [Luminiphilus sp.]MDG2136405.1 homoserine O-acetyltransferase [Luminiphilus sp.]MDG2494215.1 homoserine O-acetyltransferase [Luminiphilus sp.]
MVHAGDVGLVTAAREVFSETLTLTSGRTLAGFELITETYGRLNTQRSNAVLICHALSGNHHAAGRYDLSDPKPGWWDLHIGPGKAIDTNRFFVVSLNNLGGCDGSSGPNTMNSDTELPWGPDFPQVSVSDWVTTQVMLADRLGIDSWAAVIGGSLGGMQALHWAVHYPERVRNCVALAAAPKLTAQNIAFNEIARQAILSDPDWLSGHYQRETVTPTRGLSLARMVGHLTYMSADGMSDRFGRDTRTPSDTIDSEETVFQVESYLRYQGKQFSTRFDANTYLLMTKALDRFDIAADFNDSLNDAMAVTTSRMLIIAFSSDWRFSPARSQELVDALLASGRPVSYAEIETDAGHDAFLLDEPYYTGLFTAWMQQVVI